MPENQRFPASRFAGQHVVNTFFEKGELPQLPVIIINRPGSIVIGMNMRFMMLVVIIEVVET